MRAIGLIETKGLIGLVAATGATMHAFTSGAMVQVFQLAGTISLDVWNGNGSSDHQQTTES